LFNFKKVGKHIHLVFCGSFFSCRWISHRPAFEKISRTSKNTYLLKVIIIPPLPLNVTGIYFKVSQINCFFMLRYLTAARSG